MLMFGRPTSKQVDRLLADARTAELTYTDVGATLDGRFPTGYRHGRHEIHLGHGQEVFDRATAALRDWAAHRGVGMRVTADEPDLVVGAHVVVVVPLGPLAAVARCRIVAVLDEVDRFGFAYGSLPGHPEHGEEAFVVQRAPDGAVAFVVTVFFRHADLLVRLGGPVADAMQRRFTHRYLHAFRRIVTEGADRA